MRRTNGVYQIINKKNGKRYIGSTFDKIEYRLEQHKDNLIKKEHHSRTLQNSFNKNSLEDYSFEAIERGFGNKEKLLEREQYYMDLYQSYDPEKGYNIRRIADSNLGIKRSEESNRRNSERNKGKIIPLEVRQKISKANKGKKQPREGVEKQRLKMLGRVFTEEHRRKLSEAHKGHKKSVQSIEKTRLHHIGKIVSLETREKIRKARTGIPKSEETRKKISESLRRRKESAVS